MMKSPHAATLLTVLAPLIACGQSLDPAKEPRWSDLKIERNARGEAVISFEPIAGEVEPPVIWVSDDLETWKAAGEAFLENEHYVFIDPDSYQIGMRFYAAGIQPLLPPAPGIELPIPEQPIPAGPDDGLLPPLPDQDLGGQPHPGTQPLPISPEDVLLPNDLELPKPELPVPGLPQSPAPAPVPEPDPAPPVIPVSDPVPTPDPGPIPPLPPVPDPDEEEEDFHGEPIPNPDEEPIEHEPVNKFDPNHNPDDFKAGPDADPSTREPGFVDPEDGVSMEEARAFHRLFEILENLRLEALRAQGEFEKNSLVAELKTYEVLFRLLSNTVLADGNFSYAFVNGVLGVLEGDKQRLQNIDDPKVFKEAMEFLRAALRFQSQYRGDLTPEQRNEIEGLLFELEPLFRRLCALNVSDRAELEKIKCAFYEKFVEWKGQSDLFSTLLQELSKKLGQEGFNALIGTMLTDVFGEGVGARVTAIYSMVKDLYDMTKALLDHELAEIAIRDYNQALCGMIERAARLQTVQAKYLFVLPEGTTGKFQVWHPSSEQDEIVSTTVTPIMKCWFPKEDGEPGEGTWEQLYFKWVGGMFVPSEESSSRTFDKDHAVEDDGNHVHHFQIELPRIKPGIKCYLVLQTKRVFKRGLIETVQHFVGVVNPS